MNTDKQPEPRREMCPYCRGRAMMKEVLPLWKRPFRMPLYVPCVYCNGTGREKHTKE